MSRKLTPKPRFWALIILTLLIAFTPLYIVLNARISDLTRTKANLETTKETLTASVDSLTRELAFAASDEGIERAARDLGLVMPGEIRYVTGSQK